MFPYIFNFLSIPLYSKAIKNKKVFVFIACFQMFLILALRSEKLCVDYEYYNLLFSLCKNYKFKSIIKSFRIIRTSSEFYGMESGYVLVNWFCANAGLNFHSFLVFHAAICIISLGIYVYRYSTRPWISFEIYIALGLYGMLFSILRQTLAMSVLLWSLVAIKNKKFLKFSMLLVIAISIHRISILFCAVYFLSRLKPKNKLILLSIVGSLIIIVFLPIVYNKYLSTLLIKIGKPYELEQFTYNNMFLLVLCCLIFILMNYKKINKKSDSVLLTGGALALPIQAIAFYVPIFSRVAIGMYLIFLVVILSNILSKKKRKYWNICVFAGLLVFYIYILKSAFEVPYVAVWQHYIPEII